MGVDIFFLISGMSLAKRAIDNYWQFILSRLTSVYIKFVLLAVLASFVREWTIDRLFEVITGMELMEKGGGSFLWFLPAIMLFYIVYPAFVYFNNKNKWATLGVVMLIWFLVGYLVSQYSDYTAMFIFWNRIPVFLCGFYIAKSDRLARITNSIWAKLAIGIPLTLIGLQLMYIYCYQHKLGEPIVDLFYVLVLPVAIGVSYIVSCIPECAPTRLLGCATLEIYGFQMIYGYKIVNRLLFKTDKLLLINVSTILIITIMSVIAALLYKLVLKYVKNLLQRDAT